MSEKEQPPPQQQQGMSETVLLSSGRMTPQEKHDVDATDALVAEKDNIALIRATVSNKDDTTLPTLTFRFWLISIPFTIFVSIFNQIFWFRTFSIGISGIIVQLITLPIGRLLHRSLPSRSVGYGRLSFSLNPGPFNAKEHALIIVCISAATSKVFYMQDTPILGSILLTLTTQCIGYGLAGICYKYLVRPAAMLWPSNLVMVSLFRTFHEEDTNQRGKTTRMQFFLLVTLGSAIYYFLPGYLMTMLSSISILCLAMPNNKLANQLGSYTKGLGILSFSLDWNAILNPLMTPNVWDALDYPFYGSKLYTDKGESYPSLKLLNPDLSLNEEKYIAVGAPRMTYMFAVTYGLGFAGLAAVIMHVILYYGVPQWWYLLSLTTSIGLSIFVCEYYGTDLPWWGLLLAVGLAALFLLPIGIITAISNQTPGLNIITEFVIGFIMPGKPIANVTFKTYGYIGMVQAISFLGDFKLGHYMKIPPRDMFTAQVVGTLIAGTVNVITAYWMFEHMPDVCTTPAWYCRGAHVFFSASVIWGVIGPNRMFGSEGYYSALMWCFLIGLLLPVPFWLITRRYPNSWVKYINIPVLLAGTAGMPPGYPGIYPMYIILGFIFQFYLFRYRQKWWARYNYILSAGLDAGVAISSFIIFFVLTQNNIQLDWWGNQADFASYGQLQPLPRDLNLLLHQSLTSTADAEFYSPVLSTSYYTSQTIGQSSLAWKRVPLSIEELVKREA
ncbi:oligopeptide transporter 6-like protein [Syncephalis plumigaleata]|nr:oligopeptide transporter 6-like protein [Syncephalis plumigaleata]